MRSLMIVIPVLDLLNGVVARGVAGQRNEYRPVTSRLAPKPDPLIVARAFRSEFDLTELYVADLDAILHDRPNWGVHRALAQDGFSIMVDAGLRDVGRAHQILETGTSAVIAALETSPGPQHLRRLCDRFGPDRVIFSLDLRDGRPMGASVPEGTAWTAVRVVRSVRDASPSPFDIAERAVAEGITRMIVLDVAQVGTSGGVRTAELCRRLRERFPELRLITGGGVRSIADMRPLEKLGLEGILVASALHDGTLSRADLALLRKPHSV